jgi:hypothetical protein
VSFVLSGTVNPVEQRHAFGFFRHYLNERFSDEFFLAPGHQSAKGRVRVAHNVAASLDGDDWERRVLGDGVAEPR